MKTDTELLLKEYKTEYQNYKNFIDSNEWYDDVFLNTRNNKYESSKLSTEVSIIDTIVKGTTKFKEDVGEDIDRKPVQDFIKFTADIINKHIKRVQHYKKIHPLTQESTESDVEFHSDLFALITKTKVSLSKLQIDENELSKKSVDLFFGNTKSPLAMREFLCETFPIVNEKTEKTGIDFYAPHINPATSNEMFINMKPKDIPKWDTNKHFFEQEISTIQFWEEEIRKIKNGINVYGYNISNWLYWHLNHYKLAYIEEATGRKIIDRPLLRDNEYYFDEMYKKAEENGRVGLFMYGTRRFTKALRNDEKLYYSDGSIRNIGNCKIGDRIIGGDGRPTNIIGVYPQGTVKIFKVTFGDGRIINCCEEHLWQVFDKQSGREKTLPLKEIIKNYKYTRKYTNRKDNTCYNYYIPLNKAIEIDNPIKPFIDPYFLGLWLGDGNSKNPAITTIDNDIIEYINRVAEDNLLNIRKDINTYHIVGKKGKKNPITEILKSKNLIKNKYIPEECFNWSSKDKLELLQGLMDTDGTVGKSGNSSFTNTNNNIITGFIRLCRELGIGIRIKENISGKYILKNGSHNNYTTVSLFTEKKIFKLSRKLDRQQKVLDRSNKSRSFEVPIINIEFNGYEDATCIRVDNEDKLFLTTDCIVTHNTVLLSSRSLHGLYTIPKCQATVQGYTETPDLKAIIDYISDAVENMNPALKIPANSMDLKNGAILGLKGKRVQDRYDLSRLSMVNLEGGTTKKGTQKTAAATPDVFVFDELAKGPCIAPWKAAIPSFAGGKNGKWRTVPMLAATAGDSELSLDAETMLKNPNGYNILPMDWDLLESITDPEYITWTRNQFGMFIPAQFSLEAPPKIDKTFSEFLGIDNKGLDDITIKVTDWEAAKEYFEKERENKSSDIQMLAAYTNSFPLEVEDCYLTTEVNKFPGLECKHRKSYIEKEGLTGAKYRLYKDSIGDIQAEMTPNDPTIDEYPFKGGNFDAPIVMLENPLLFPEKPPLGLYVIGFDDVKQDSTSGDSVISATVFKRGFEGGEWANRIVAWYDSRPDKKRDYYRQLYLLMKIYNARVLYENEDNGFIEWVETNHPEDVHVHFSTGVGLASEENLHRNNNRKFGWSPTPQNIYLAEQKVVMYTKEDNIVIGDRSDLTGVDRINHPMLLEELYKYKKGKNADRLRSFSLALTLARYYDNSYQYMKTRRRQTEDSDEYYRKAEKNRKMSNGIIYDKRLK